MDLLLPIVAGLDFSTLPQQLINGILIGSIYALIALGYTMVYGILRLINFAHGEVFMLGAYAALYTSWSLGFTPDNVRSGLAPQPNIMNLIIMIFVSMAVCAIVGVIIEFFAYKPMRNQSKVAALITAIGVSLLLQYGGQLFFEPIQQNVQQSVNPIQGEWRPMATGKYHEIQGQIFKLDQERSSIRQQVGSIRKEDKNSPEIAPLEAKVVQVEDKLSVLYREADPLGGPIGIQNGKLIMFLTAMFLMLVLRFIVMSTPAGRAMRAVSHDFDAAGLMGINVNRVITFTFMIGSALAGAGAMMYATFEGTGITPFYGVQPGVKAFVAAVLGGIGNIPGAVLGAVLMGVAETLVVWAGFSQYKDAVAFVILIAVLMVRPGGLLGSNKVEKV